MYAVKVYPNHQGSFYGAGPGGARLAVAGPWTRDGRPAPLVAAASMYPDPFDFGGAYGLTVGGAASIALVPVTGGLSLAAGAATGQFRTAKQRCRRYRDKYKLAKRLHKRHKKIVKLRHKMAKWCGKAKAKAEKKAARRERKEARREAKHGGGGAVDVSLPMDATTYPETESIDTSIPDMAPDEGGFVDDEAEDEGGLPSWALPVGLAAGAGLLLFALMK